MPNWAWKALEWTIAICVGLVLAWGVGLMMRHQFEIYRKKHGQHMTWSDFLWDAERWH